MSFSCAMQVNAFRMIRGNRYVSTMCIGNLKSGTSCLARSIRGRSLRDLMNAGLYYSIIVIFAIGAGIGGVLSRHLGIYTIWISCAMLLASGLFLMKEN